MRYISGRVFINHVKNNPFAVFMFIIAILHTAPDACSLDNPHIDNGVLLIGATGTTLVDNEQTRCSLALHIYTYVCIRNGLPHDAVSACGSSLCKTERILSFCGNCFVSVSRRISGHSPLNRQRQLDLAAFLQLRLSAEQQRSRCVQK